VTRSIVRGLGGYLWYESKATLQLRRLCSAPMPLRLRLAWMAGDRKPGMLMAKESPQECNAALVWHDLSPRLDGIWARCSIFGEPPSTPADTNRRQSSLNIGAGSRNACWRRSAWDRIRPRAPSRGMWDPGGRGENRRCCRAREPCPERLDQALRLRQSSRVTDYISVSQKINS